MLLLVLERALSNDGSHGFSVYPLNVERHTEGHCGTHSSDQRWAGGWSEWTFKYSSDVGIWGCNDSNPRKPFRLEWNSTHFDGSCAHHTLGCALIVFACVYAISLNSEYGWAIYLYVQLLLCDVWCARECMRMCVCVRDCGYSRHIQRVKRFPLRLIVPNIEWMHTSRPWKVSSHVHN